MVHVISCNWPVVTQQCRSGFFTWCSVLGLVQASFWSWLCQCTMQYCWVKIRREHHTKLTPGILQLKDTSSQMGSWILKLLGLSIVFPHLVTKRGFLKRYGAPNVDGSSWLFQLKLLVLRVYTVVSDTPNLDIENYRNMNAKTAHFGP